MNIQLPFPELLPESSWRPPDSFPDIGRAKWWSLDCETHDPNLKSKGPGFVRGDAFVAGVAIHTDGFSGYFPVRHGQGSNLAPNVVFEWLNDQVKTFRGELYGANLLYDEESLWFEGVRFHDDVKRRDVQIAEPCLDEESFDGYSLEVLSRKYLGESKDEVLLRDAASLHTKGYKDKRAKRPIPFDPKGDLWLLQPEYVGAYAEADVRLPKQIYEKQRVLIDKEDLWQIFDLESSLIPILLRMRIQGVRVDLEAAHKLVKVLSVEIDKYSMEIKKLVGFDPNVDSGQDMTKAYNNLHFAYPELGIDKSLRYTALGNASFTAEWYSAQSDPLSRIILKKKKLCTLRDDFVVGDILKESVNGRLHCQFVQLKTDESGTRSGRMASRNPNLQQVPNRHDGCDADCPTTCTSHLWGKHDPIWSEEVRKLFVPDEGKIWCKSDYSAQEPRLTVHFAALCNLEGADLAVAAFKKNPKTDFHQMCTDIVNSKSGRNFKRRAIKAVNLGIAYGAGAKKLSKMLGISIQECYEILTAHNEALPFIKKLSTKAMTTAQDRGFILSILKRRCRFSLWEPIPESKEEREFSVAGKPLHLAEQAWPGRRLQRSGVHKALNRCIQSSASDELKKAMAILYYEHKTIFQLVVHDEGDTGVEDKEEARLVKRIMEEAIPLVIPVVCETMIGPSWGAAKEEVELAA